MTETPRASAPQGRGQAGLTTGAVARRLGVSPTTLRSWDRRYGLGPAAREDGRHRRWTQEDVAVLTEMCRLTAEGIPPAEAARVARGRAAPPSPAARPPDAPAGRPPLPAPAGRADSPGGAGQADAAPAGAPERAAAARPGGGLRAGGGALPLGDVLPEARGLARAAVRLDAPAVQRILGSLMAEYGVEAAWQEVMMPTLHAVGRKWESSNDRYVEVEHLLSWHISSALRCLAGTRQESGGPPVLLACVPGEQHTLALEALVAALAERGLPIRMLGGAVPVAALEAAARRIGPAAIVLWSQTRSTASVPLARHLAGLGWGVRGARYHPAMLLCGPGWAGRGTPDLLRPASLQEALSVLERVCTAAASVERPA